ARGARLRRSRGARDAAAAPKLLHHGFERAERALGLERVEEPRRLRRPVRDERVVGGALVAVHPDPLEAEPAHHLAIGELRLGRERPRDDDLPAAGRDRLELAAQLVLAGAQELRPRPAAVEVDMDEVALALEITPERALAGAGRARDQQQPTARCPPATRI